MWNPSYKGEIEAPESIYRSLLAAFESVSSQGTPIVMNCFALLTFLLFNRDASKQSLCHIFNGLIDFPSAAPTFPQVHSPVHDTRSAGKPVFLVPEFRASVYQLTFFKSFPIPSHFGTVCLEISVLTVILFFFPYLS